MNYFTNNIYIQGALFDVAQTSTVTEQTSTLGVGDTESVIGIYPWTMILTLVNFVVLFFILKKFLLKPVLAMIEKRSDIVKKDINDAQFAKEESLKQKKLYDDKMVNLKNEAIEIISTAQKKADRNADEIIADANKKAAAAMERSEKEIERQKNKAINEVKEEVGEMATMIAGKIIQQELSLQDNEKLIEKMLDEIE